MKKKNLLYKSVLSLLAASFYTVSCFAQTVPTANLQLWLKADAGVTESGGLVSAWADQSAAGNNATQGTTGSQPTLVASAVNGQPAISFDGVDDFLSTVVPVNGLNNMTLFVVSACSQASITINKWRDNASILHWSESGAWGTVHLTATQEAIYVRYANGTTLTAPVNFGGTYTDKSKIGPGSNFSVVASTFDGSTINVKYNGQLFDSKNFTGPIANTSSNLSIGRGDTKYVSGVDAAPVYFPGQIAEIIIFNATLNASDITSVETYLMTKYGISNTNNINEDVNQSIKINVYPNPATNNNITVELNNSSDVTLQVIDICGKLIHSQNIKANTNQIMLSKDIFNAGMYIIKISDNKKNTGNYKLIVQ